MPQPWISARQVQDLLGPGPFSGPAYRELADRLRLLVVDGRLTQGVRMPSERGLSIALGLSRTTVAAAYGRLRELGYLRAQQGSGSFVTLPRSGRPPSSPAPAAASSGQIRLTHASPAAPPGLATTFIRATEDLAPLLAGHGYLADGLPSLRERLAQWFGDRGLPTDPDQVIVTTGALSALNTVLRTLTGPGDRVLMESPTYPSAIDAVRRSGARPVGYPLGPGGWQPADLDLLLRQTAPRLTYLIPDFQNPTAALMSADVRAGVAESARRNRTQLVVDETLVELGLEDRYQPVPPLASFDPGAITIGSASKAYWGGLRVGWIRAPRSLVPALIETRAVDDIGSPVFEQLVLSELLGGSGQVLADHRLSLRARRDRLYAALVEALPDWEVARPAGGLSLWIQLPRELSTQMAALAGRYDLVTTAGPRFFVGGGGERHLRVPFCAPTEELPLVVERLAHLWAGVQAGRGGRDSSLPVGLTA